MGILSAPEPVSPCIFLRSQLHMLCECVAWIVSLPCTAWLCSPMLTVAGS